VQAHGGRVEAESDAARGTTFRVRLPKAPAGEARSTA
jgi:signal transduction histidine kinase